MLATCLGCGCTCDDIQIAVEDNRIVEAVNACELGLVWFGDGRGPNRIHVSGRTASLDDALDTAARMLAQAARPLVYLAPDISCEAQREAIALADVLHAMVDTVTSSTVMDTLLAAQEVGRAGATLGEVRNRADVLVFWGVDPARRYPRYTTRYGPDPIGIHLPDGRRSRTVVSVDVGESRGPVDADVRVAVAVEDEVATLTAFTGLVRRNVSDGPAGQPPFVVAGELLDTIEHGRYAVFVADAEPDDLNPRGDAGRASALITLTQALNGRTRCALSTLRGGGNRSGAETCLTSQTGYPAAVDFARGYPRYRPHDGAEPRLARGDIDAVLALGSSSRIPVEVAAAMRELPCAVAGPRASEGPLGNAAVVIDTGVAGIHEDGTVVRMDDVPLPVRAVVRTDAPAIITLARALRARVGRGSAG